MAKFTYASGDRPLDGYVIKRGIGQGGFGEVYYAVSEAGKEVALKLVRGNADIELRGMQQCINLKHSNLVALYDIRVDTHGDSWVIMEYVAGESLLHVLNRHAGGLPLDQVQSIFGELCLAMEALHECGIVHRDLKPANVFIENGMVKVGDYGLCKFISGTQKSPQTQSIGTVHYMAPEISTGNYGKQVDVYAAGVMLYEMITGKLPFDGESVGEILMKHLTSHPDLAPLPKEYKEVVGRALHKNPHERYKNFNELAEAVAAAAGKTVQKALPKPMPAPLVPVAARADVRNTPTAAYQPASTGSARSNSAIYRDRLMELCWSLVQATLFSVLAILLWAAIESPTGQNFNVTYFLGTLNTLVLLSWTVLITGKFWDGKRGDPWPRRTVLLGCGLLIGALSGFLSPFTQSSRNITAAALDQQTIWTMIHHAFYFGISLFAIKWWERTERYRPSRFSFWSVAITGFVAFVLLGVMHIPNEKAISQSFYFKPLEMPPAAVALTLASIVVQLASPWSASPPRVGRRLRWKTA
jgi:eukaryotic-like serine/threonine-protein kinase